MPRIEGLQELIAKLKAKQQEIKKNVSVIVGYTQQYAIWVHENLEAHHPVGKAKFLEDPARRLADELSRIVSEALLRGKTLEQALVLAGLRLQRESQKEVPVLTGALKGSAFTRLETNQ